MGKKGSSQKNQNSTKGKNKKDPALRLKYIYFFVLVLPFLFAYIYYNYAFEANKVLSFTLDDPWIHLTFAKNLSEYFSFSYYKNEMSTAGSTSPLYTFILSAIFFFFKDEMHVSYFLGVVFFSLSAYIFFKLALSEFSNELIAAILCTGLFMLDKWLNFISLSGMETTLFIFLLITGAYTYKSRKMVQLAVILGLIIWTRPDGIAFVAAIGLTYILEKYFYKPSPDNIFFKTSSVKKMILILFLFTASYFLMNISLSGTILPNTYSAKIAYFIDTERQINFLAEIVWSYFTDGYYILLMIGFGFSFAKLLIDIYKKNYNQNLLYWLFIILFLLMYTVKMPAINRFGRYMMPLIPFLILLSASGYREAYIAAKKMIKNPVLVRVVFLIFTGFVFINSFADYEKNKKEYQIQSKHIYDRQVKTAQWIKKNTNDTDIIATHDIGAIGFYSGRRLVDVAGLVNEELNAKLNEYNYSDIMTDYLINHKVSYLAFLEEWYSVSNQLPVYGTPEVGTTENMHVYKFNPGKTHILSKEAHSLMNKAGTAIVNKDPQQLLLIVNRVIELEPEASYPYYFKAFAYHMLNDSHNYVKTIKLSISLFPDFKDARVHYIRYLLQTKQFEAAKMHLTKVNEIDPSDKNIIINLNAANDSILARQSK